MKHLLLWLLILSTLPLRAELLFFELDRDGDGRLKPSESGSLQREFAKWDRNSDGLLSYGDFRQRLLKDPSQDHRSATDLAYAGESNSQRLDLYLPDGVANPPVLVWIHGGSWNRGDKYPCPVRGFTQDGWAVASINYRLTGEAPFPAQLEDCSAAMAWLRNQKDYPLDHTRMVLAGSSAGGHLAMLSGDEQTSAVCAIGSPCDLTRVPEQHRGVIEAFAGGKLEQSQQILKRASPLHQADGQAPAHLLIHGTKDPLVPWSASLDMARALARVHVSTDLFLVPGAGHGLVGGPQTLARLRGLLKRSGQ